MCSDVHTHHDNTCFDHPVLQMEIYTLDNIGEQRDQLKEILSSHQHLPPQLEFSVIVCPYIDL